jgi:archaellum component FlaF (FlaF/FlaG flagellin family)
MDRSRKGIISVILGILGLIGIVTSHTGIGILLCIAGAVVALVTLENSEEKHGFAKAGMASSMAGVLVLLVFFRIGALDQSVPVAKTTPDQVNSAKEEEVFSKDDITISVTGIELSGSVTTIGFSVYNASESDYSIEALTCSINGEMVEGELKGSDLVPVAAGQAEKLTLPVECADLSETEVIFRAYSGNTLEWDSGTVTIEND